MDFFYILSESCNSHTHFSANDVRKSYLPIKKDLVLISSFSPQVNPSSSLSRSTQSSHTLCHLSKPRKSLATSNSHIFMHLPKPQKPFWPASVSMLSHIPWLVNFFVCSKLLSCAKCAPNFSSFLIYLCLLEITHIICKLHLYWCWLWRVWWPNCTSCQ